MQNEEQRKDNLEAKAKDCKDAECLGKLVDSDTKAKAAYEENLEKEIESLKGKEIPTEVKEIPFKITKAVTITEMNSYKRPQCEMELELTQDITLNSMSDFYSYTMLISFIDNEGNSLGNKYETYFTNIQFEKGMTLKAGTKFTHSFDLTISKKNLDKWQNFEKIVLEKKPNL